MSELDRYYSWHRPDVARSMRDLVTRELDTYKGHPPYAHFLKAMEQLGNVDGKTFLDAGCGVGHYSEVLLRNYPHVRYSGLDFSRAMVEEAQRLWPGRTFIVADMVDYDYSVYDIVLASSLIEVMDDWAKGSEALCRTLSGVLILHRVRIHSGPTVRNEDDGYPGQLTYCHVHNEKELLDFYRKRGLVVSWYEHWQEFPQATYIFKRG